MPRSAPPDYLLMTHLHRAAIDPAGWQEFVLVLERQVGAKASIHGVSTLSDAPFVAVSGSFDPDFIQSYLAHFHRINPFMPLSAAIPHGRARVSPMDLPEEILRRTEFYNDWLRPQEDLSIAVAVKSRPHGNRSLVLSLNIRRRDGDRVALRAQRLLDRLEPHLSHAFQVSEIISALSVNRRQVDEADGSVGGLLMVDDRLSLIWADPGAMTQAGAVFRLDPFHTLVFRDDAVQDWAKAVCRTCDGSKGHAPVMQTADGWQIRFLRPDENSGLPSPFFGGYCFARPRILLVLSRRQQPPLSALVQSRFRLTRAEAEIAVAIAQGMTTDEIAVARHVSRHTVRNQIRSVLDKMAARRRIDVARTLARMTAADRP